MGDTSRCWATGVFMGIQWRSVRMALARAWETTAVLMIDMTGSSTSQALRSRTSRKTPIQEKPKAFPTNLSHPKSLINTTTHNAGRSVAGLSPASMRVGMRTAKSHVACTVGKKVADRVIIRDERGWEVLTHGNLMTGHLC